MNYFFFSLLILLVEFNLVKVNVKIETALVVDCVNRVVYVIQMTTLQRRQININFRKYKYNIIRMLHK